VAWLNTKNTNTGTLYIPVVTLLTVEVDGFLCDKSVSSPHLVKHVRHPVFNAPIGSDVIPVIHDLAFAGTHRHRHHLVVDALLELQIGYVVEHL